MGRTVAFRHQFVEVIPASIEESCLYVSLEYGSAAHLCACGCGTKVVTPIQPTDWSITFDGETVSLHPSVGNWSFPCRSHYWINQGTVHWAKQWSDERIAAGRAYDRWAKEGYFTGSAANRQQAQAKSDGKAPRTRSGRGLWAQLSKLWSR